MKYHKTINGDSILLCDLELSHLKNIIKFIERKSIKGLTINYGTYGSTADDMSYEKDIIFGEEAKTQMHYKDYICELNRRTI